MRRHMQRMPTRMAFAMMQTIVWVHWTRVAFAMDPERFMIVDAQTFLKEIAIVQAMGRFRLRLRWQLFGGC